jgi:hypothetical protein
VGWIQGSKSLRRKVSTTTRGEEIESVRGVEGREGIEIIKAGWQH